MDVDFEDTKEHKFGRDKMTGK